MVELNEKHFEMVLRYAKFYDYVATEQKKILILSKRDKNEIMTEEDCKRINSTVHLYDGTVQDAINECKFYINHYMNTIINTIEEYFKQYGFDIRKNLENNTHPNNRIGEHLL